LLTKSRRPVQRGITGALKQNHGEKANTERVRYLPPSWGTLYQLTRVPNDVLLAKIEDHTINPEMQRKDVAAIFGRHPKTKARRRSKAEGKIIEQAKEIESHKAYIAELKASRDTGLPIEDIGDDAEKFLARYGKERSAAFVLELQNLVMIANEAAA
jgi:hypothetical protein